MRPTFDAGDIVGADTLKGLCGQTHPRPGDVVVHVRHGKPIPYMMRIVAGPGQMVALRRDRLIIDGRPVVSKVVGTVPWDEGVGTAQVVRETLPNGATYLTLDRGPDGPLDEVDAVRVPQGAWYVLGDNRDNALDSRVPAEVGGAGFVPDKDICGIANIVIWAKDKSHVGQKP